MKFNVKKIDTNNSVTLSTVCKKQLTAINRFTRFLESYDSMFTESMLRCFMNIKIIGYVNGELVSQAVIEENEYTMFVQISDNTYIVRIEFHHDENTNNEESDNTTDTTDTTESDTTDTTETTESDNTPDCTNDTINNILESIGNKHDSRLETLTKLENLFDTVDRYKNSYMWNTDNGNISAREYKEKRDTIDEFEWYDSGDKYTAEFTVKYTRNNVYAKGIYTKNGKQTTLTAIKNSYNRLLQAVQRE